ncbi:MAG: response regulator [Pseudomonadota bacterium]
MSAPAKVLLVDDDPVMRELASAKLRDAGYDVLLAENGAIGLEKMRADKVDLVISDLDMPVMDGFELTKNIREDRTIASTPVIVITSSDHPEAVDRVFAEGATSFLAKPINWTLFSQAVMFVLRASQDQENLRLARDQAEAGAKFKDALMSVMSHELRTPLNAIIGFGQLLSEQFEKQNDVVHREYAKYIVDGGRRLLNSVSDMLLASDVRSGPLQLNETDATAEEIVKTALAQLDAEIAASDAALCVRLQDPEIEICGDRTLLARALAKLIDNAIKFSPSGVNIVIGAALNKKGDLAFLVKDNGPGVSPEKLKSVSAPFAQSDMSLSRTKEGLGLGLPMTKAIAAAHGARFRMDSVEGQGASALIILPAERVRSSNGRAQSAA